MQMGMSLNTLPPGMQYHSKANLTPQVCLPIRFQYLRSSLDQVRIHDFLIPPYQRIENMIDRKDNMEIGDWQQPDLLCL